MSAPKVTIFVNHDDPVSSQVADLLMRRPEDVTLEARITAIGVGIGCALMAAATEDRENPATFLSVLLRGIDQGARLVVAASDERVRSGKGALQ